MSNPLEATPEPKASRVRVFQAADRILRSGRRPTVEAIRELLGGGSPNSVTAYIQDWYQELGSRLVATEEPLTGFPREAVSLMGELWRIAAAGRGGGQVGVADDANRRVLEAERGSLLAQITALEVLNQELQHHRASAERSLAEARALLARREVALEEERAQNAELQLLLATTRVELEVCRLREHSTARATPPKATVQRVTVRKSPGASGGRRKTASKVRNGKTRVAARKRSKTELKGFRLPRTKAKKKPSRLNRISTRTRRPA